MKTSKNTSLLAEKNISWQKPIKKWFLKKNLDLKNLHSLKM